MNLQHTLTFLLLLIINAINGEVSVTKFDHEEIGVKSLRGGRKSKVNAYRVLKKEKDHSIDDNHPRSNDRTLNGIFEGDIIADYDVIMKNYGPDVVKELEDEGILDPPTDNGSLRNIYPRYRWSKRVNGIVEVPYYIQNTAFTTEEVATITTAIKELGDRAKVIKFVPRNGERDYISVIKDNAGCYSYVGHVGGPQELSLKTNCLNRSTGKGIAQHEFMHALGLFHEQSRPDRDQYVNIEWENVQNGAQSNFEKMNDSETLGNEYDYGSVMHYSNKAFSKNRLDTITATESMNGKVMGQRFEADEQDIIDIRLLYQCASGPRTLSQYKASHCTTDCKCWENEVGCNGNNNACQGSLICRNNTCRNTQGLNVEPFTIKNGANCVSVHRMKKNKVKVWNCYGGLNQQWTYDETTKEIRSMIPGRQFCLALTLNHHYYDDGVSAQKCDNSWFQKWYFDETVGGTIKMIRLGGLNGQCLEKDPRTWEMTVSQANKCYFSNNQQLYLGPI